MSISHTASLCRRKRRQRSMDRNDRNSKMAGRRAIKVAFLLASATISVTNASDIKDRYIRQAIVRPTRPIGQDVPDVDVLFEDPQKGRRKLTSSKSSKSDSSNKSSKSDKSSKQETYYLVVYPTPPKSQSSSWLAYDEYMYYDPHSDYYHYDDWHTDWPTYAHPETERGGHPSLDASPDEETSSPAFSEDEAPSQSPSAMQCPVSAMLQKCPELLQTIEPEEGCDCYNFCSGLYLGCCGIDEPCPLECNSIGGFVAGCQFDMTPSPSSGESIYPSTTPTLPPTLTSVPTITPTFEPSLTPSPTITNSPSTTLTPTISAEPTTSLAPSNATDIPTQSAAPTIDSNTLSPTIELSPVALTPFTLEYELGEFRPAAQSDLVELTTTTNSYLQSYMLSAFQSEDVLLVDFVTTYDSHQDLPDSSVVLVTFGSSALFDPESPIIANNSDLEMERASAFEGMALSGYLGIVQSLSANNLFASTMQVFLVQSTENDNTEDSRVSGVGMAAASFAAVMLSILTGAVYYRHRRKKRRRHASQKFLKDIGEMDSTSGESTMANSNEGMGTDFGELERIEVTLCETEQDEENLPGCILEHAEEEIVFEQERGYIYSNETAVEESPMQESGLTGEGPQINSSGGPAENDIEHEQPDSDCESESSRSAICEVKLSQTEDSYGFSSLDSPPSTEDDDQDAQYISHVWSLTD